LQILKTNLQIFANDLQNVGSILKFVAQKGGLREVGPPILFFLYRAGNLFANSENQFANICK